MALNAFYGALCRVLDTLETLRRRMGVLQLQGFVSRCADALPSKAALLSAPRSRAGTTLLNEKADARSLLTLLLEEARTRDSNP